MDRGSHPPNAAQLCGSGVSIPSRAPGSLSAKYEESQHLPRWSSVMMKVKYEHGRDQGLVFTQCHRVFAIIITNPVKHSSVSQSLLEQKLLFIAHNQAHRPAK